jgi:hypothetical protein
VSSGQQRLNRRAAAADAAAPREGRRCRPSQNFAQHNVTQSKLVFYRFFCPKIHFSEDKQNRFFHT